MKTIIRTSNNVPEDLETELVKEIIQSIKCIQLQKKSIKQNNYIYINKMTIIIIINKQVPSINKY